MAVDARQPSRLLDFVKRLGQQPPAAAAETVEIEGFDLLRARVEIAVESPAVIAVTSATTSDGREIAARGLAYSLSQAGYSTLFIDTALATRTLASAPRGLEGMALSAPPREAPGAALPTIVHRLAAASGPAISGDVEPAAPSRQLAVTDAANGRLATMTLNDIMLQRTTSLPAMKAALNILRGKFDYVVISTEFGMSTAFGAAIAATADAVLVSYQKGRRKYADDTRLAAALAPLGPRFLGLVELHPEVIALNVAANAAPDMPPLRRRRRTALPWFARLTRTRPASLTGNAAKLESLPAPSPEAIGSDSLALR